MLDLITNPDAREDDRNMWDEMTEKSYQCNLKWQARKW